MYYTISDSFQVRVMIVIAVLLLYALPAALTSSAAQIAVLLLVLGAVAWLTPRTVGHPTKYWVSSFFIWCDVAISWFMLMVGLASYLFLRSFDFVWWSWCITIIVLAVSLCITAAFYGFAMLLESETDPCY